MRDGCEEVQFLFLDAVLFICAAELLLLQLTQSDLVVDEVGDGEHDEGIDEECPDGGVPWGCHMDGNGIFRELGRVVFHIGLHTEGVGTWW